jgi:hypothetical protein
MPTPPIPVEVLTAVYAADENLAVRAAGDFTVLCPEWQQLAAGADGVISSGDLWTLTSATANFTAGGVRAQHVVLLSAPKSAFRGGGQLLAVDSVPSAGSVTLRRLGGATGVGQPPSPPGGLTGVQFLIATLDPQIEEESFSLNQIYAIDPDRPGRRPLDTADLRVLRWACVLGVLFKRYMAESREERGDFPMKARLIKDELDDVYDRLTVRWTTATIGQDTTNRFTTRLVR